MYTPKYDGLDGEAELLAGVVPQQGDLCRQELDPEGDDLRDLEVETDSSSPTVGKLHREVLVEGSGGYQEEVDPYSPHSLPTLVSNTHLQCIPS